MTHGILLLDKPVGISSNAALTRAKRVLGIKKAGHTGTLDPLASGLLVLCFGEATKVAGFLLDAEKAYEATIHLGIATDTEDGEGEVTARANVPALSGDDIEKVLDSFRGEIEQIPPMHSALKHQGRRLYELARKGEDVERPARRVTILELNLIDYTAPELKIEVRCTKGTYIRSLARDIGQAIGCGAHLTALRRTASTPFSIDNAVRLDALDKMEPEQARNLLLPPDDALAHLPAVTLDKVQAARLRQGQRLAGLPEPHAGPVRVYGSAGFLGVGEMDGDGRLRPVRLFATA